jgi:hypothetical protein
MSTTSKETVTRVEFDVRGSMVIADPCYIDTDDEDGGCLANGGYVLKQAGGSWVAEIELSDESGWGERVASITATRKGAEPSYKMQQRRAAMLGVDSGQMYLGCKTDLLLDYDDLLSQYNIDKDKPFGGDNYMNRQMFAYRNGVVCSTGIGDGVYPCDVKFSADGKPCVVTVTFLGEDADDGDLY